MKTKIEDYPPVYASYEKEKLQKLLDNFYEVCSLCEELDIYEWSDGDKSMQEMQEWVEENFGRKIE